MADAQRPDARMVAAECARRIDDLVRWLGLDAPKTHNEFKPLNPTRHDRTAGSFVIYGAGHAKAGGWCDFATGDKGDAMDLCGYVRSGRTFSRSDAFKIAMRFLGWDGAGALTMPDQAAMRARIDRERADAEKRQADDLQRNRDSALAWWLKDRKLVRGDWSWRYLTQTRGIDLDALPALPNAIRTAVSIRHKESGLSFAAMRCLITAPEGAAGQKAWGVHTTFLRDVDGVVEKAPVDPPRKIWPAGFWGGAIRLSKGASGLAPAQAFAKGVRDVLAIGEGVETCLTVALAAPEWRVWAAGSKGAIGAVEWPACVRAVVLLAENDEEGRDAKGADDAAATWARVLHKVALQAKAKEVPVYQAKPRGGDSDWNDALQRLRAGELAGIA